MLKKNLIRDTKDSKSTSVALVSESIPSATKSSVIITELDPSNPECLSEDDSTDFDESLALLTKNFRRFAQKSNFHKFSPLCITDKPKSTPVDKATSIFFFQLQVLCIFRGRGRCRSRRGEFVLP